MPKSNDVNNDDTEKDFEVLPVIEFKSLIIKCTNENQIFICISETGSGKTTQIPQFYLDGGLLGANGMIAITQPRRVAAITVAHRVSEERKCKVGEAVGYSVRFDDQASSKTRIKYMTDGILLRECLSDPLLSKYNVVMLDEAHERSINTGRCVNCCYLRYYVVLNCYMLFSMSISNIHTATLGDSFIINYFMVMFYISHSCCYCTCFKCRYFIRSGERSVSETEGSTSHCHVSHPRCREVLSIFQCLSHCAYSWPSVSRRYLSLQTTTSHGKWCVYKEWLSVH